MAHIVSYYLFIFLLICVLVTASMVQLTELSCMFLGVCEQVSLDNFIWLIVQQQQQQQQQTKKKQKKNTQINKQTINKQTKSKECMSQNN